MKLEDVRIMLDAISDTLDCQTCSYRQECNNDFEKECMEIIIKHIYNKGVL